MEKSNGNYKNYQKIAKKIVDTTLVSIVSYPGKKANRRELDGIQSIIGCSRSTEKHTNHRVSAKQAHLLSVPTDKTVKWAVKPQFPCKKKVDDALIRTVVDWVLHNSNVRESLIVGNTLLID